MKLKFLPINVLLLSSDLENKAPHKNTNKHRENTKSLNSIKYPNEYKSL